MFYIVLINLIIAVLATVTPASNGFEYKHRIFGGKEADIENLPYVVSIKINWFHSCGGAIITNNHVITAAHCTRHARPKYLQVRTNSSLRGSHGDIIRVKDKFEHPNYKHRKSGASYDIAVLILNKTLIFGIGIQPIGLPLASDLLKNGTMMIMSGWGFTINPTRHLQKIEIPFVDSEECKEKLKETQFRIDKTMICAGDGHRDACAGDSGGPLVSNNTLYGIASFGNDCIYHIPSQVLPGVYADVRMALDFIKETTARY